MLNSKGTYIFRFSEIQMLRQISVLFAFLLCLTAQGQSPEFIPLNEHFYELPPEQIQNKKYQKMISITSDSIQIERFFTLENKLIRVVRMDLKKNEYQEFTMEEFDLDGNLTHQRTANLFNSKFIASYFEKGELVGQIFYRGEHKYTIYRKGYEKPLEMLENDFEPYPKDEKARFMDVVSQKTGIPYNKWPKDRQLVIVGVKVDLEGNVKTIEWVNPSGASPEIAEVFVKAVASWKKGYVPAKDFWGNPVEKWRYFHFHAGGKLPSGPMEVKFSR